MAKSAENVSLQPVTKGMQSNYSHYVASPNSWSWLENFDCDTLGILKTRPNINRTGTTNSVVLGAGIFERGSSARFLIKVGTELYNMQADVVGTPNLTSGTFLDSFEIARFDTCQGATIIACRRDGLRLTLDGNTITNFLSVRLGASDQIDLVNAGFSGRIWGAVSNNFLSTFIQDQLYYSDVIPTSGIQNTTGSGQFLKVNTKGKYITGLMEDKNILYVFTSDSIFRVYSTQSLDNAPFANVGTTRQEAIVKTFDSIFFMHYTGVYEINNGQVSKISQPIDDVIQKFFIPFISQGTNNLQRVFSWFDDKAIYFSIDMNTGYAGVSANVDRTYILRYNYVEKLWTVTSLKDFRLQYVVSKFFSNISALNNLADLFPATRMFGQHLRTNNFLTGTFNMPTRYDGSKPMQLINSYLGLGDWANDTATSTDTTPIFSNAETQWITFGEENTLKSITGLSIPHQNAQGFQVMYQIDNENLEMSDRENAKWTQIGTLDKNYVTFFRNFTFKDCYRIKLKISGQTLGQVVTIGVPAFLSVNTKGYGVN